MNISQVMLVFFLIALFSLPIVTGQQDVCDFVHMRLTSSYRIDCKTFQPLTTSGRFVITIHKPSAAQNPDFDESIGLSMNLFQDNTVFELYAAPIVNLVVNSFLAQPATSTVINQSSMIHTINFAVSSLDTEISVQLHLPFRSGIDLELVEIDSSNPATPIQTVTFRRFSPYFFDANIRPNIFAYPAFQLLSDEEFNVSLFFTFKHLPALSESVGDFCFGMTFTSDMYQFSPKPSSKLYLKWTASTTNATRAGMVCISPSAGDGPFSFTFPLLSSDLLTPTVFIYPTLPSTFLQQTAADLERNAFGQNVCPYAIPGTPISTKVNILELLSITKLASSPSGTDDFWYTWTLSHILPNDLSSAEIHFIEPWWYRGETFIFSCAFLEEDVTNEYTNTIQFDPLRLVLQYSLSQLGVNLRRAFEIRCIGTISPYYSTRTDEPTEWGLTSKPPFITDLISYFPDGCDMNSEPVDYTIFPSINDHPLPTLRASIESSFLLSPTQSFQQIVATIVFEGYTYSPGLEISTSLDSDIRLVNINTWNDSNLATYSSVQLQNLSLTSSMGPIDCFPTDIDDKTIFKCNLERNKVQIDLTLHIALNIPIDYATVNTQPNPDIIFRMMKLDSTLNPPIPASARAIPPMHEYDVIYTPISTPPTLVAFTTNISKPTTLLTLRQRISRADLPTIPPTPPTLILPAPTVKFTYPGRISNTASLVITAFVYFNNAPSTYDPDFSQTLSSSDPGRTVKTSIFPVLRTIPRNAVWFILIELVDLTADGQSAFFTSEPFLVQHECELPPSEFDTSDPWTQPCQNQGVCTPLGMYDYRCACVDDYWGRNCENLPLVTEAQSQAATIELSSTFTTSQTFPTTTATATVTTIDRTSLKFRFDDVEFADTTQISVYKFVQGSPPMLLGRLVTQPSETELEFPFTLLPPLTGSPTLFAIVHYTFRTSPNADQGTWEHYWFTTEFFTFESPCLCQNGGICDFNSKCICKDSYWGDLCELQPCSQCDPVGNDSCKTTVGFNNQNGGIAGGTCACDNSWFGVLCDLPIVCSEASKTQCKNNGFLSKLTPTTPPTCDLAQSCTCVGNWHDTTCSSCKRLECKNGGRVAQKTCTCGCATGFVGDTCSCRGVTASLSINAYNLVLWDFQNAVGGALTDLQQEQYQTVLFQVINVFVEMLKVEKSSIISLAQVTTHSASDDSNSRTKLTLIINFGCPTYNPNLTEHSLKDQFLSMLQQFTSHETIRDLFIFVKGGNDEADGTFEPVSPTLPEDDGEGEEQENPAFSFTNSLLLLSLPLLLIFSTYSV